MAAAGLIRYAYLAYFSQPSGERELYRALRKQKPVRIVELGMRNLDRSLRLISVAQRFAGEEKIQYTCFDRFEERPATVEPMPLIHAYRGLQATGAKVRVVPGEPAMALPQVANALQNVDLLLISAGIDQQALSKAWFYVPRMCHATTLVMREMSGEVGGKTKFVPVTATERAQLAGATSQRRAA